MARLRLPDRVPAERREASLLTAPPGLGRPATVRHLLLRSWAGRLFLISAAVRLLSLIGRLRK